MLLQGLRQHLHDRRFTGAADSQVANANDRHAEMVIMNVAMPV